MAVRIRSLEVKPDGPLRALLKIDCGDLVVVYGKNESGKSYIVEALLQFLFKSGKQSGWELRDFEPAGSAFVDGLDGGPVKFSRTSSGK
ncbi:MAG: ATP-binding protein, partial [Planctomycetaceae bacterium]|nr:ATP-binding protein [Planctomycetaceae bacterium]